MTSPDLHTDPQPPPSTFPVAGIEFFMRFARALHRYGAPAHRLEDAISSIAERLKIEAQVLSLPTSIIASFGPTHEQFIRIARVDPGEVDLRKLTEVDALGHRFGDGELNAEEASAELSRIEASKSQYTQVWWMLGMAAASASSAVFFGGGVAEASVAGIAGVVIGLLGGVAAVSPRVARIMEPIAALLTTLLAAGVGHVFDDFVPLPAILGGLIALLPGFSLTVAMNELATRHLVSGTARLSAVAMTLIQLGFGVAVGIQLAGSLGWSVGLEGATAPGVTLTAIALGIGAISFGVLFRVRLQEMWAVIIVGVLGFLAARVGVRVLGPEIGVVLGALTVGLLGNLFARFTRKPSSVVIAPAILLLVPGSIGFRSIATMMTEGVLAGLDTAFAMMVIATSLVAGLLTANVVLRPRGAM